LEGLAKNIGFECISDIRFGEGSELWPDRDDVIRIVETLQYLKPDIVHVNGYRDQLSTSMAVEIYKPEIPVFKLKHNSFEIPKHPFIRYAYRELFDHVGVVAKGLYKQMEWLTAEGIVDISNISVHHGGIKTKDYVNYSKSWGKKSSIEILGTVARLAPEKGIDILIKAFHTLVNRVYAYPIQLHIVGDGPQRNDLEKLSKKLDLENIIHFKGYQNDVRRFLADMDAFILPSIDCEASSLALKEAMAIGIPSITTNIGGSDEIIQHGKNGFLVKPNSIECLMDQIRFLLNKDIEYCKNIGEAAKSRILSKFSIENTAISIEKIYQKLHG